MKTLTVEEIECRLKDAHGDIVTLDKSSYVKIKMKATFIDRDYGVWSARADSVLGGQGHPKRGRANTARARTIPIQNIKARLEKAHAGKIEIIELTYRTSGDKATFIDKETGLTWEAIPSTVISQKTGHPSRRGEKIGNILRHSIEHVNEKLLKIHNGKVKLIASTYKSAQNKAAFVDDQKGIWWALPTNVTSGSGHPDCSHRNSKGQREIAQFVESLGFKTEESVKIGKTKNEIDIFIPSLQFGIEYNGTHWHSEKFKPKDHREVKTKLAAENGIQMIHVEEGDWTKDEQHIKTMLKDKLTNVLKNTTLKAVNGAAKTLNDD